MDHHVLCTHPPLSPAVQRCCDARNRAIEANLASTGEGLPEIPKNMNDPIEFKKFEIRAMQKLVSELPHTVYLAAMPEPSGKRNIKAFIARVIHGMMIGVIEREEGKDLLYAARTAAQLVRYKTRRKKPAPAPDATPAPAKTEYEMYVEECRKLGINKN